MAPSVSLAIVHFCAAEVDRQQDGPRQVAWLVEAWADALASHSVERVPTLSEVMKWGYLAARDLNTPPELGRWRGMQVYVGDSVPPPPQELANAMTRWHEALPRMTPEEAYTEFERIHPFRDGNGRVGKIIFFWLRNELDRPDIERVPNPWGILNP